MIRNNSTIRDEQQIRELIESWAKAVRNEDMAGALANHAEDIVMFDVPPPLQSKGIAAYERTWELFFSWSQHSGVFDIIEMTIVASDTVAFSHGIMRCAGKEADGKISTFKFRLTMGFRKINSEWAITHEHHSLPSR